MIRATALSDLSPAGADRLELPYAERYRRRGRLTTVSGEDILLDLPEATELAHGVALVLEDGRRVAVEAAAEPLAEVRAEVRAAGASLARLAWHVGNRHTPCQIEPDRLLIQRDHVLEAMLAGLGATLRYIEAPFSPEGGAYGHGRTHGHSHGPADHDPNAHIPHRHD
ncbi:MAG: urease accessory protein UreE [Pseudomonadota bacterium]